MTTEYMVIDQSGKFISLESTAAHAREVADDIADVAHGGQVFDESGGCSTPRDNPRGNPRVTRFTREGNTGPYARETAERSSAYEDVNAISLSSHDRPGRFGQMAFEKTGLPYVSLDEVSDLTEGMSTLKHVYDRLEPYLRGVALGQSLERFTNDHNAFLSSNYKMSKSSQAVQVARAAKAAKQGKELSVGQGRIGNVRGLVLLPFWEGVAFEQALEAEYGAEDIEGAGLGKFFGTAKKNALSKKVIYPILDKPEFFDIKHGLKQYGQSLCHGSSYACRASCLITSGQQFTNLGPKMAFTSALRHDTVAFCALLAWHCLRFFKSADAADNAFIRLNVMSDVPWEIVFPGLFDISTSSGGCQYYDYSKLSPLTREQPENYDWTYSFSGENWPQCLENIKNGFRIATVFAPMAPGKGWTPQTRTKLPATFAGYKVIDGDKDDMRALDPGGVVVGLRYKPPKVVSDKARDERFTGAFVVPVTEIDGRLIAVHTPRQSHGEEFQSPEEFKEQFKVSGGATAAERRAYEEMKQYDEYWKAQRLGA